MRRYKKLLALVAALVLCCLAAFAVTRFQEEQEAIRTSGEMILAIAEEDLRKISWDLEGSALSFQRDDSGQWRWEEDEAFPVDHGIFADMISVFEDLSAAFVIEAVTDFDQYGLDDPECTIQLETADTSCTVTLGNFSTLDAQRYLSIGDGNVYLVSSDPLDSLDVTISDLIDHDEIPVFDTVSSITFAAEDGYTFSYQEEGNGSYCAEDVYYWDGKPLDTENVEAYLYNLSYLELLDYASYNATQEELASYGLDDPALTVTVAYPDPDTEEAKTFVIHVGIVTEEDEETTAYARVGDSQILYQLPKDDENSILAYLYDDLRHKDVFPADFDTVTAMDITLEDSTYHLQTAPSSEGDDIVWTYGEAEIDVTGLRSQLYALTADSFTDGEAAGKAEIRMVIHMENDYADTMQIVLYRQDGAYCLCEVNGESTALVLRSQVVDLMEAVNTIVLS